MERRTCQNIFNCRNWHALRVKFGVNSFDIRRSVYASACLYVHYKYGSCDVVKLFKLGIWNLTCESVAMCTCTSNARHIPFSLFVCHISCVFLLFSLFYILFRWLVLFIKLKFIYFKVISDVLLTISFWLTKEDTRFAFFPMLPSVNPVYKLTLRQISCILKICFFLHGPSTYQTSKCQRTKLKTWQIYLLL